MLYIFSGLPAVGKTSLARHLATQLRACYLRIDSVEHTLRHCGVNKLYDEGYKISAAIACDNLKTGQSVVVDSTNPVLESRQLWWQVAQDAQCKYVDIEVICGDQEEHRHRVENREADIPGLILPGWQSVINREFDTWQQQRLIIDTAGKTLKQSQKQLLTLIRNLQ